MSESQKKACRCPVLACGLSSRHGLKLAGRRVWGGVLSDHQTSKPIQAKQAASSASPSVRAADRMWHGRCSGLGGHGRGRPVVQLQPPIMMNWGSGIASQAAAHPSASYSKFWPAGPGSVYLDWLRGESNFCEGFADA